ncbi:TerD family protein [Embleya sp. NPDC020630]|uniref:TerD family protein n=1 Tax=Embleya sp. NPDC020630 TaxID=3363979 RepID=UPI0037A1C9D2
MTVRIGDRLACPGYSVVAVETTGLSPHRHRIIEIAVAQCDLDGRVTEFFTTLLDPQGPAGDFQAHGLFDDDVVNAPTFAEVAPWLANLFRQRVVVAHNARFDIGFVEREFQRRGRPTVPPLTTVCTMREAPHHLPEAPRFTLLACCEAAGVPVDGGHGAAAKAMGTARLLEHYLSRGAGEARHWQQARTVAASLNWPRRSADPPRVFTRDDAHTARRAREEAEQVRRRDAVSYLEKARAYGPPTGVGEGPDSYLAVLDAALEDRVITPQEAIDLAELAVSLGISEEQRKDLDRLYVTALAASMVAAGPIDREERADLTRVAAQLGIPRTALDEIVGMARSTVEEGRGGPRILARGRPLESGLHVLFHGYLAVTRGELERRMARADLSVASGIHDRVDVLVVADPDESADRTYWARQRGIRVLIEPVFLALLADLERGRSSAADAASQVAAASLALAVPGMPRTTSGFLLPRPSASAAAGAGTFTPGPYRPYDTPVDGSDVLPAVAEPTEAFEATEAFGPDAPTEAFDVTEAQSASGTPMSGAGSATTPAPVPGAGATLPSIPPPPTAADLPVAAGSSAAEVLEATVPDVLPPPPEVPSVPDAGPRTPPPVPGPQTPPQVPPGAGGRTPPRPTVPVPPPVPGPSGPVRSVPPKPEHPASGEVSAESAESAAEGPAPTVPPRPAIAPPRGLTRGQAVTIEDLGPFAGTVRIEAAWWAPAQVDGDTVALVLDDDRRVADDGDLVFFNQPVHASGAVRLAGKLQTGTTNDVEPGSDSVEIDVTTLPPGRSRVVVALALDATSGTTFAQVPVTVGIVDPVTCRRLAEFRLSGGDETVMILAEVYRRGDSWRLRAVGQGYAEGLAALVIEHGVVVDD